MNELILVKEIYPLYAVRKSSEEFKNIAEIKIIDKGDAWKCTFKPKNDIQLSILISEYENYIIDLINSEKLYDVY